MTCGRYQLHGFGEVENDEASADTLGLPPAAAIGVAPRVFKRLLGGKMLNVCAIIVALFGVPLLTVGTDMVFPAALAYVLEASCVAAMEVAILTTPRARLMALGRHATVHVLGACLFAMRVQHASLGVV